MSPAEDLVRERAPWAAAVESHRRGRDDPEALYPSESRFVVDAIKQAGSVVDLGCATGGFCGIVHAINPQARYVGVDISPEMVATAKRRYPNGRFVVSNGDTLALPDEGFDLALCLGTLHMTLGYRKLLAEGFRVCRKQFVFDMRLAARAIEDVTEAYQLIGDAHGRPTGHRVPYVTLTPDSAVALILGLPGPAPRVRAYGYAHPPSPSVHSPHAEVCMATFSLDKHTPGLTEWELPMACPRVLTR